MKERSGGKRGMKDDVGRGPEQVKQSQSVAMPTRLEI